MTPATRVSYLNQIDGWRDELHDIGVRLDTAGPDEVRQLSLYVSDMRLRIRKVCDELGISTLGDESIDSLIAKIIRKVADHE